MSIPGTTANNDVMILSAILWIAVIVVAYLWSRLDSMKTKRDRCLRWHDTATSQRRKAESENRALRKKNKELLEACITSNSNNTYLLHKEGLTKIEG